MKRFNEIAHIYDAQIPEHIRLHLLDKKTRAMQRVLSAARATMGGQGTPKGLDIGCGTGWHVKRMCEMGFNVVGLDIAQRQLECARVNAAANRFAAANVLGLPFADATFDFAYAINVIHHIHLSRDQQAALAEIARVLRPGGMFFLHEINTLNPAIRFYMDYLFPRMRHIDDGRETWIMPTDLSNAPGFELAAVEQFTFIPDFAPRPLFWLMRPFEAALERTCLRKYGAHFVAILRRV
ncbi:MAG: methyltransferase domain-containing protein [Planctomycetes bacterium]|nr:methyltransferase domain-containing protein [Planctomycetota bacterium]MBM4079321.1 methyltransferase domain-containing protein [Planctomycetota bacterium]MBM4084740.1 methyltransferase domain-containing protein [Planctomycetota bacterium]